MKAAVHVDRPRRSGRVADGELFTRLTLLVPGKPASASAWSSTLRRRGLQLDAGLLRGDELGAEALQVLPREPLHRARHLLR